MGSFHLLKNPSGGCFSTREGMNEAATLTGASVASWRDKTQKWLRGCDNEAGGFTNKEIE